MPRRRTDDAVHVVMTDHLIARRPPAGDLLAEKPERAETAADSYHGEVVPYYPAKLASTADNELTVAVAQVREQSNLTDGFAAAEKAIANGIIRLTLAFMRNWRRVTLRRVTTERRSVLSKRPPGVNRLRHRGSSSLRMLWRNPASGRMRNRNCGTRPRTVAG